MEELLRVVELVTAAFKHLGLDDALGGAIANTYWGIVPPRTRRLV
jgi:hypothetical protein